MMWRSLLLTSVAAFYAAAQQPAPLVPGASIERQLAGGEAHEYQLSLGAGQFAAVTVEQRGIDVLTQLLDPTGSVIAAFDSEPRKQAREFAGVVSDSTSNYRLRIKPVYSLQAAGRYAIRVADIRAATDQDRAAFESHKLGTQAFARQERGAYDETMQLFERALERAQAPVPPDAAYVGELFYLLAVLKRLKGDYAGAQRCLESAVLNDQKALGRESPQTAVALRAWGNLFLATSEYAKAEPLLQESLEITERTLGPEHPSVALCLRLLGNLHGYLEDLERARAYLQRALAIAEKTFDPDDVSLIAMVHDVGDVYRVMGEYERAEPFLERTVAFVEKKYGPEHIQLASPLHNLGSVAFETKKYARALELYERAHAIREKVLGAQNPDTARILTSIADVYIIQGDYAKALEVHRRALDLLTISAGPYHRSTMDALEGVSRSYLLLGDLPRAIQFQSRFDEALERAMAWSLAIGSDREKLAYLTWIATQTDRTVSLHALQAPDNPAARDLAALVVLQRKGRGLDAMSGSMAALRQRLNAEDRKLLDELQETNATLANLALAGPMKTSRAAWEKQLADLEERRERLESNVSGRSGEFRSQSRSITLADLRAAIPREAALVEFATYRRSIRKSKRATPSANRAIWLM
jgi:tetratricopeptide (TPR) repeat protein